MSDMIAWIAAEAEKPQAENSVGSSKRRRDEDRAEEQPSLRNLPAHQLPAEPSPAVETEGEQDAAAQQDSEALQRTLQEARAYEHERRVYRARTVTMLRRYMRYSIETGRLPSLLGKEFFRAKVTAYTVVTFEDRVIFVHDMERCLDRLDEFSRQLIARHILQEHDRWATAKLLHCNEKTVRRLTPLVLDLLSEILLDVGLMKRMEPARKNSCQEGENDRNDASDCEDGKYKF